MSKKLFNIPIIEVSKEMNYYTKNGNVKTIKTVNKLSENNQINIISQGRYVESNNDKLGLDKLYKPKKTRVKKVKDMKLDIKKNNLKNDDIKLIDNVKLIPLNEIKLDIGKVANIATKPKKTVNFNPSTQDINKVKGKKVKSLLTP